MKIALITDLHFGKMQNSPVMLKYQENFFNKIFFPYLKKNKIKNIISLGDEFDSKKTIDYFVLNESKSFFFDIIESERYHLDIIVGNHTLYYKNDHDINSPELLFGKYKNIHIISKPEEIVFDKVKMLFMPWINELNKEESLKIINKTDATYLLGHFEINNLKLYGNWEFYKGLDHDLISKFKEVWSGHYHLRLKKDNFFYLGTPYQLDKGDVLYEKGFYVFDTDTEVLEFIQNPLKIFSLIDYSEDKIPKDLKQYEGQIVTVVLNNSIDDYNVYDKFIHDLSGNCYDYKVHENYYNEKGEVDKEQIDSKIETTLDVIKAKCETISHVDKDELFEYISTIYKKAKVLQDDNI